MQSRDIAPDSRSGRKTSDLPRKNDASWRARLGKVDLRGSDSLAEETQPVKVMFVAGECLAITCLEAGHVRHSTILLSCFKVNLLITHELNS